MSTTDPQIRSLIPSPCPANDREKNFPQIIFEVIQDIIKDRLQKFVFNRKSDNKQIFNRKVFAKVYFCNKGIEMVQFARLLRRFLKITFQLILNI